MEATYCRRISAANMYGLEMLYEHKTFDQTCKRASSGSRTRREPEIYFRSPIWDRKSNLCATTGCWWRSKVDMTKYNSQLIIFN